MTTPKDEDFWTADNREYVKGNEGVLTTGMMIEVMGYLGLFLPNTRKLTKVEQRRIFTDVIFDPDQCINIFFDRETSGGGGIQYEIMNRMSANKSWSFIDFEALAAAVNNKEKLKALKADIKRSFHGF